MNTTKPAPLLVAYNILGRMQQAARTAGDLGQEFVTAGVHRLIEAELASRSACAREADTIAADMQNAEKLFAMVSAHANLGRRDLLQLRAALSKPRRHAGHLAARLNGRGSRV